MIRSRRAPRLPGSLAAHLPSGDRALAVAELSSGQWAVVAPSALLVLGEEGVQRRDPWHEIQQGVWEGETRQLTVTWVEGTRAPLVLTTAGDDVERFTAALRERVQSSVVHVESEKLPGGATVHVHVRRDERGELFSQLTAQGALRGDADEQRLVDGLERRARSAVGLGT